MSDESPALPTADITALRTVVRDGWYKRLYGSGLVEGYVLAVLPARHQPRGRQQR